MLFDENNLNQIKKKIETIKEEEEIDLISGHCYNTKNVIFRLPYS